MKENPLLKLSAFGQSIWLDYIRRQMIDAGELKRLIDDDGLKGVTSNPAIFQKAIAGSTDYDVAIRSLAQGLELLLQLFLQFEATVIRGDAHSHGGLLL